MPLDVEWGRSLQHQLLLLLKVTKISSNLLDSWVPLSFHGL